MGIEWGYIQLCIYIYIYNGMYHQDVLVGLESGDFTQSKMTNVLHGSQKWDMGISWNIQATIYDLGLKTAEAPSLGHFDRNTLYG